MPSVRDRVLRAAAGAAVATAAYALYELATSPPTLADSDLEIVASGIGFAEGPRWRPDEGKLYFSDMYEKKVYAVRISGAGREGKAELVVEADASTSGLGWLPDGRLLVVLMESRSIAVLGTDGKLLEHVSLRHLEPFKCNDMVVDGEGRCYVGGFGFDLVKDGPFNAKPTRMSLVDGQGTEPQAAADDVMFPNGAVITPNGRELIVAETFRNRLTAFDRDPLTGALSNRRVWASLSGLYPDGICLDAEGCVWVACAAMLPGNPVNGFFSPVWNAVRARRLTGCFVRVGEGGVIHERVLLRERMAVACMLGGEDGKTVFMLCSAPNTEPPKVGDTFIARKRVNVGAARDTNNVDRKSVV